MSESIWSVACASAVAVLVPRCVNWRMSQALRARGEKAEITYADFRNEVLAQYYGSDHPRTKPPSIGITAPVT